MIVFVWTGAVLGVLYGIPAYCGALAARGLVRRLLP